MELSELQKRKLDKMNVNATAYGETSLTEQELDSFMFTRNSILAPGSQEELRRERLKEMMLVDTESAEKLKEAFPDLYAEAKAKEQTLTRQANISGMDKVKNDFFGSKKREARSSLAGLKQKRDRLFQHKKAKFDAVSSDGAQKLLDRKADLEQQKADLDQADPEYERKLRYIDSAIGKINTEVSDNPGYVTSVFSKEDTLFKASEQNVVAMMVQNQLFSETPVISLSKAGVPTQGSYSQNANYRDISRFTTRFHKDNEADLKTMEDCADAVFVMETGCHAGAKYIQDPSVPAQTPKLIKEKASRDDQLTAFKTVRKHLKNTYDDMKNFESNHPQVFLNDPDPEVILANFSEINELYKKGQPAYYIGDCTTLKSDIFKDPTALSEQEKAEFTELSRYTTSMAYFSLNMVKWFKHYAEYMEGKMEDPGAFADTHTLQYLYDHWQPNADT